MIKPTVFLSGKKEKCSNYVSAFSQAGFNVEFDDFNFCDALCLCGGGDLSPCLYGSLNKGSVDIDINRDVSELYYLRRAFDKNMPIIAICRGLQVLNVYCGGTLKQSIKNHDQIECADRTHSVKLFGNLAEIYGARAIVNSAHHQSIARLGKDLSITAISDDGIIEGVSYKNAVAFQFHPERLKKVTDGDLIFKRFYSDNFC